MTDEDYSGEINFESPKGVRIPSEAKSLNDPCPVKWVTRKELEELYPMADEIEKAAEEYAAFWAKEVNPESAFFQMRARYYLKAAYLAGARSRAAEIERERMRLAACGTAALGYFEGCADEYRSASLEDVLRLRARAERYQKALESISKNGCCDSCQEAKLVAKEALRDEEG